jgi:hypothetical protein
MTEAHAEKKSQYWCFDGSSWRLVDDPMPDIGNETLFEWYGNEGFELLLGPGETDNNYDGPHISLWTRHHGEPACVIDIFHGVSGGGATVYAERLPDGIDLYTRWAPAIYRHGGDPKPSKK